MIIIQQYNSKNSNQYCLRVREIGKISEREGESAFEFEREWMSLRERKRENKVKIENEWV